LLSLYPADVGASKPLSPSTSAAAPVSDPTIGKIVEGIETGIEIASHGIEIASEISAETSATLVDYTREFLGKTRALRGYEWAFLLHAVLSVPTFFCIRTFRNQKCDSELLIDQKIQNQNSEEKKKETNVMNGLRLISKNFDALVFYFLCFVIGTSSGCIENFAYVRVREVGGTGHDMGMLRLVSSMAGSPMFWFSGPITKALGTDIVLVLSLLAYVVRFFNYAWIKHPYHALPAEALRGAAFALFWSAGSIYAHKISPPGMSATMLLTMNAMYGGLGQSLGAIVGGRLQSRVGTVSTFVYSGMVVFGFVSALVVYLLTRSDRAFS
jgi:predicted MFS family arabinose efflux permease